MNSLDDLEKMISKLDKRDECIVKIGRAHV